MTCTEKLNPNKMVLRAAIIFEMYEDILRHWETGADPFKRALALTIIDVAGQEESIGENQKRK